MPFAGNADGVRYLAVRNDDTVPCPPFGLMRVTGIETDDDNPNNGGAGVVVVARPDRTGMTGLLVNGPQAIPANGGLGTALSGSWPALAAVATDNPENASPETGETWGVEAPRDDDNEWVLRKGIPGYEIVGPAGDLFAYVQPSDAPTLFPAKVTARGAGADSPYFAWTEQRYAADGTREDDPDGRSGTAAADGSPALEAAESAPAAYPAQVWMRFARTTEDGPVYEFLSSGGTGLTVREFDTTPSLSGVSTLTFNQVDGFVVSNPAAGDAKVDLAHATATQAGGMSTTTQTFGGNKTFNGTVTGVQSVSGNSLAATTHVTAGGNVTLTGATSRLIVGGSGTGSEVFDVSSATTTLASPGRKVLINGDNLNYSPLVDIRNVGASSITANLIGLGLSSLFSNQDSPVLSLSGRSSSGNIQLTLVSVGNPGLLFSVAGGTGTMTIDSTGRLVVSDKVSAATRFQVGSTNGITQNCVIGSNTITVTGGIITGFA